MIEQTLATCNNYLHTGRPNKAVKMLEVVARIDPENEVLKEMRHYIAQRMLGVSMPDMTEHFGSNWRGEDLNGKRIEIFCDQGMGDTIQMLRYLYVMEEKWPDCRIVLNNYAFFDEFTELLKQVEPITVFAKDHLLCHYHTNILCLPSLLNELDLPEHYPTPWSAVLETEIPEMPKLAPRKEVNFNVESPSIGLVFRSNPNNVLCNLKSIPPEQLDLPEGFNIVPLYTLGESKTLADTAALISKVDRVVSVDTVTLHLAGAMGKPTYGLLPKMADPRWSDGESTVWYPSVKLFRQTTDGDWTEPLKQVKDELASLT